MYLSKKKIEWQSYQGSALSLKDEIHIFRIDAEFYFDKINQNLLLNFKEQQKAIRFRHARDKKNYVVGKHISRVILAGLLNIKPADLKFYKEDTGKPMVNGMHFNISHTSKYVFIAISNTDIGIDAEYMDTDFEYTDILNNCFSSEEIKFVKESETPRLRFYLLWTRKEALIKATGEGISNVFVNIPSLENKVHRNNKDFYLTSINEDNLFAISMAYAAEMTRLNYWDYQV